MTFLIYKVLRGDQDLTGMRKEVKDEESSLRLQAIWDFEVRNGYLSGLRIKHSFKLYKFRGILSILQFFTVIIATQK